MNISIQNIKDTLFHLAMPLFCRDCGLRLLTEENGYFCPACWQKPQRIQRPFCSQCGQPHALQAGFGEPENYLCAACREVGPRSCRRVFAAAVYEGAIAEAVKLLKFKERRRIAQPLAELMIAFALQEMDCDVYDVIVPVPLHKVRLRERGFNQAQLLTEQVIEAFPGAEIDSSLKRIRPTRVQSRINNREERTENVVGAFAVDREVDFSDARILLIDDVVTPGGTVAECAKALKRAGAAEVDVLATATQSDYDKL